MKSVLVSTINTKNLDDVDQSNEERFDPETIFADDLNILARAAPRFGRAAPRFGRRFAALSLARLQHPGNYMFNDDTDDGRNENFSEERKRASPRYGRSF